MQKTIKKAITFEGIGLHSGRRLKMILQPAEPDYGIVFQRTDIHDKNPFVPALWSHARTEPLCTQIRNDDQISVSTIEHLMAALAGCGVHNLHILIDGPEAPIFDGSAFQYVRDILTTGLVEQNAPLYAIKILKPITVEGANASAQLLPAPQLTINFSIDFDDELIRHQEKSLNMLNGCFVHELAISRTFCQMGDVKMMRASGRIKGGSFDNALVFNNGEVLTPGGARHKDEPVRHKMLDAMGDLYLLGAPLIGAYRGKRASHAITTKLLHKLMNDKDAWEWVKCSAELAKTLPGAGVTAADIPTLPS